MQELAYRQSYDLKTRMGRGNFVRGILFVLRGAHRMPRLRRLFSWELKLAIKDTFTKERPDAR